MFYEIVFLLIWTESSTPLPSTHRLVSRTISNGTITTFILLCIHWNIGTVRFKWGTVTFLCMSEIVKDGQISLESLHVRKSKTVLNSGFHAGNSWFQVLDSSLWQRNLDSGFQSLVGFRLSWATLRVPKPRINSGFNKQIFFEFYNPDSLHRATWELKSGYKHEREKLSVSIHAP